MLGRHEQETELALTKGEGGRKERQSFRTKQVQRARGQRPQAGSGALSQRERGLIEPLLEPTAGIQQEEQTNQLLKRHPEPAISLMTTVEGSDNIWMKLME